MGIHEELVVVVNYEDMEGMLEKTLRYMKAVHQRTRFCNSKRKNTSLDRSKES